MRWTAHAGLLKTLQQLRTLAEPHTDQLRADLATLGIEGAQTFLRENVEFGLDVAGAGRTRPQTLAAYAPAQRPWVLYAAAAWTAKALVLAEQLDVLQLEPTFPAKFAPGSMLRLIGRYEQDEEAWLWPFPGFAPWDHFDE